MESKQIKLSDEDIDYLSRVDSSIESWSVEHAKKVLESEQMMSHIRSLYAAKNQFFGKKMSENNISNVVSTRVERSKDGIILVISYEESKTEELSSPAP